MPIYRDVAADYGIPWMLLVAQGYRENKWNTYPLGALGELGIHQLMPSTWEVWKPREDADWKEPRDNIEAAARYLVACRGWAIRKHGPQWRWAFAAYNWGIGNVNSKASTWGDVPKHVRVDYVGYIEDVANELYILYELEDPVGQALHGR